MDYLKLTGIFLGANGLWKLLEHWLRWRSEKRVKHAEAHHFFAQANKEVVASFLQLSQELKEQVQRQKERIDELERLVVDEKKRNDALERHVARLEQRNQELKEELNQLKHDNATKP